MAIDGTSLCRRRLRRVSRACFMSLISRRSLDIRSRMRRRSVSILVSPGPRVPTPPPLPPAPPPCRDIDSPQPRSLGSMYSICAKATCALPFPAGGLLLKDVENERGAVDDLDLDDLLQRVELTRRQFAVEDDGVGAG